MEVQPGYLTKRVQVMINQLAASYSMLRRILIFAYILSTGVALAAADRIAQVE